MPKLAFLGIHWCLHFSNDCEKDATHDWEDTYLDTQCMSPETAKHRAKFGTVEDVHNARWKDIIVVAQRLTFEKTCCAGWYHSYMTIGPNPKPIQTVVLLHSM